MPAMASVHLKLHHEANHDVSGAQQDRLQKIDRPVIITGYSQRRMVEIYHSIQHYNLLRDMLLQCADLSLQKSLRSTTMTNMSVVGLMTELEKETSGGVKPKLYETRLEIPLS